MPIVNLKNLLYIFSLIFMPPAIFACELSKTATSSLCSLFGLETTHAFTKDERQFSETQEGSMWCRLPVDVQPALAKAIIKQYPQLFTNWAMTTPAKKILESPQALYPNADGIPTYAGNGASSMLITPDGTTLITCSLDGILAFWKLPECSLIKACKLEKKKTRLKPHLKKILASFFLCP